MLQVCLARNPNGFFKLNKKRIDSSKTHSPKRIIRRKKSCPFPAIFSFPPNNAQDSVSIYSEGPLS
jgi:hypothetical protein